MSTVGIHFESTGRLEAAFARLRAGLRLLLSSLLVEMPSASSVGSPMDSSFAVPIFTRLRVQGAYLSATEINACRSQSEQWNVETLVNVAVGIGCPSYENLELLFPEWQVRRPVPGLWRRLTNILKFADEFPTHYAAFPFYRSIWLPSVAVQGAEVFSFVAVPIILTYAQYAQGERSFSDRIAAFDRMWAREMDQMIGAAIFHGCRTTVFSSWTNLALAVSCRFIRIGYTSPHISFFGRAWDRALVLCSQRGDDFFGLRGTSFSTAHTFVPLLPCVHCRDAGVVCVIGGYRVGCARCLAHNENHTLQLSCAYASVRRFVFLFVLR